MITFLDDVVVRIPMFDAWDQFVWLPGTAMPRATTEAEQYGYCHGHAVDLSPVMPAMEFRVTDEEGTYLCVVWALIFEGSVLAYNPARDEVEWVPTCGIANDLSWVEERSAVVLVNFIPRTPHEVAHIAGLRTCCLMSRLDDSYSEEEGDNDGQAEEGDYGDGQAEGEGGDLEEDDPADLEEPGELSSGGMGLEQGEMEREADPQRRSREWGSILDNEEPLAFEDPWSDSNTTVSGCSPVCLTPQEPGSPQDVMEVHTQDSEVEVL